MSTQKSNKYRLPYGDTAIELSIPEESGIRVVFDGSLPTIKSVEKPRELLFSRLDSPSAGPPLRKLVKPGYSVLILIEDNTRNSPLRPILAGLLDYLEQFGVTLNRITLMVATGTHRMMSKGELREKLGDEILSRVAVKQHDYRDSSALVDLGTVSAGGQRIPVRVNRAVIDADLVIGTGDIKPHCDAGFSGGAKILEPGVCGYATTAATHIAAALLDEIPLGLVDNPCRLGIEEAAKKAGLDFIVNTITNTEKEIIDIVSGDFVTAHRIGSRIAAEAYGTNIPEAAELVVVSSFPADIDWWQAQKGLIAASFAVRNGGTILLLSPAAEGLEHNHPQLRGWLPLKFEDAKKRAAAISPENAEEDLIAADIAMGNARAREKARILVYTDGLDDEDLALLGYQRIASVEEGLVRGLEKSKKKTVGLIPKGGEALPIIL